MSRAFTDDEASREMKKMVTFILQEANEKAKEIRIKADEEFNIEKAKLVRQETVMIESNYSKRLNQADVKKKIAKSNQINKSRLKVLEYRDELFQEIINEAKDLLPSIKSDTTNYSTLLKSLCLEVFYRFMESDVALECLKDEEDLVKAAAEEAKKEFEKATNITLKITIIPSMNDNEFGGVIGVCKGGRIRCSNTLIGRLQSMSESALPAIRQLLFGVSSTRKYFD